MFFVLYFSVGLSEILRMGRMRFTVRNCGATRKTGIQPARETGMGATWGRWRQSPTPSSAEVPACFLRPPSSPPCHVHKSCVVGVFHTAWCPVVHPCFNTSAFPSSLRLKNILLCVCGPCFVYPIICRWTLGLFPPFSYCE